MNKQVSRLYLHLLRAIGRNPEWHDVDRHCAKYRFQDFNFFALIGDLTDWNVAHVFSSLDIILQHDEIPLPIVLKEHKAHNYALLLTIETEKYLLYNPILNSQESITKKELEERFDSFSLLVQPIAKATRPKKKQLVNLLQENPSFALIFTLFALGFSLVNLELQLIYYISIIGVFCSYLLGAKKRGGAIWTNRFCETNSNRVNCNKVLDSSFSRFFGLIPLEYLGYFFFLFNLIYFLIVGAATATPLLSKGFVFIQLTALGAVLALFGVQLFLIRSFCTLCLVTSFCVICNNVIIYLFDSVIGTSYDFIHLLVSGGIAASVTILYGSAMTTAWEKRKLKQVNEQIINDTDIFRSIERGTKRVLPNLENEFLINFSPNAKSINLFLKEGCAYCEPMLQEILSLLLLSNQYYLSLKYDTEETDPFRVWEQVKSKFSAFREDFNEQFNVRLKIDKETIFLGTIVRIDQQLDLIPLAIAAIQNDTPVNTFPSVFVTQKEIHRLYDGLRLKRHLVLAQYT